MHYRVHAFRRVSIFFLSTLATTIGLTACSALENTDESKGKSGSGNSTATSTGSSTSSSTSTAQTPEFSKLDSFLTKDILTAPAKTKSLTAAELEKAINGESGFLSLRDKEGDAADSEAEFDPQGKCMNEKLGAAKIAAKGSEITISIEADLSECSKLGDATETEKHDSKNYSYSYLEGCDLSGLDGKTADSPEYESAIEDTCKPTRTWFLAASRVNVKYTVPLLPDSNSSEILIESANMTKDGKPCESVSVDDVETRSPCSYVTVTKTGENVNFTRLDTKTLKAEPKSKYFSSGTIDFVFNDWSGTMTYSGPNQAPQWKAERGDESASGTLQN